MIYSTNTEDSVDFSQEIVFKFSAMLNLQTKVNAKKTKGRVVGRTRSNHFTLPMGEIF